MPQESPISNQSLVRRTLIMVGVMVGGCVFVVGTLTLVASSVVGQAVGSGDEAADGGPPSSAVPGAPGKPGMAKPRAVVEPTKKK